MLRNFKSHLVIPYQLEIKENTSFYISRELILINIICAPMSARRSYLMTSYRFQHSTQPIVRTKANRVWAIQRPGPSRASCGHPSAAPPLARYGSSLNHRFLPLASFLIHIKTLLLASLHSDWW